MTNEELFLTGQHIEQYRHATYLPDPYYLEGLKRDKGDIRINNAYGLLLLRRGCFGEAEGYFRQALKRLTWKNPNPYDSEAYYNLGLALFYQDRKEEAFDAFYKAAWSNEQQEMSFYYLAAIESEKGHYEEALEFAEKGLVKNAHNIKARGLKAVILRKLGRTEEARRQIEENLEVDPFDYLSRFELAQISPKRDEVLREMNALMRGFRESYLQTARDYAESGCLEEALAVLGECSDDYPMLTYYRACCLNRLGETEAAEEACRKADSCPPLYCFPNKLEDIAVLKGAMELYPEGAMAYYYLGDLYYDKLQYERAVRLWEDAAERRPEFPTVHRNLALAYYNKQGEPEKARAEMEKAFALDETDARVFLELDQLYKKLGVDFETRLKNYEEHIGLTRMRDDVMIEYVTLCNLLGMHEKAYETIMSHTFGPWEGAEGKIAAQHKTALLEMAKKMMEEEKYAEAEELLERCLVLSGEPGRGEAGGNEG